MFGLTDIKKINERAAAKGGRHFVSVRSVYREKVAGGNADFICEAHEARYAQEIADALNLADAFKEAQAEAVGRT